MLAEWPRVWQRGGRAAVLVQRRMARDTAGRARQLRSEDIVRRR